MKRMIMLEELKEKLKRIDEVTLLELLDITSDDIVVHFEDFIEEQYDKLIREIE